MKQKILLRGLLFLILLVVSGCKDYDETFLPYKDNIVLDNEKNVESPDEYQKVVISNGTSSYLLPPPNELDPGWIVQHVELKNISTWPEKDRIKAEKRGFIEGYVMNLDEKNIGFVTISISAYERLNKNLFMEEYFEEMNKGERDFQGRHEKLSFIEDPNIGDASLMVAVAVEGTFEKNDDGELSEFVYYEMMFIKYNVPVNVRCVLQKMDDPLSYCIKNAKMIEERIEGVAMTLEGIENNMGKYIKEDPLFNEFLAFGNMVVRVAKYSEEEILNTSTIISFHVTKKIDTQEIIFEETIDVLQADWTWEERGLQNMFIIDNVYGGDYELRLVDKQGVPYFAFPFHLNEEPMMVEYYGENPYWDEMDPSTIFFIPGHEFLEEVQIFHNDNFLKKWASKDFIHKD